MRIPLSSFPRPRFGVLLLRVGVSALLLLLVLRLVDLRAVGQALSRADLALIGAGVAIHFASLFLATARWRMFLRALLRRPVAYAHALGANFVGNLYAMVIPGGQVVGDGAKIFWLRAPGDKISAVAASVVFDKVLAVSAVGCFAVLALSSVVGSAGRALGLWVGGVAALALFLIAALAFPMRLAALIALAPMPARWRAAAGAFVKTYFAIPRSLLAVGFGIALLGQLVNGLGLLAYARALGIPLGAFAALWIYGLVLLLSTLPVTISGLGLREGAFLFGFALAGFDRESALGVAVIVFGTQVLFALGGAIVSFLPRPTLPVRSVRTEPEA